MLTKVQRWDGSLARRMRRVLARDAQLEHDSVVEISMVDGQIVIQPVTTPNWTLVELLSGVNKDNFTVRSVRSLPWAMRSGNKHGLPSGYRRHCLDHA